MTSVVKITRDITWDQALVMATFRYPRGLAGVVERVQDELGVQIGSRNTFGRFLRVEDPSTLGPKDQLRAWLLMIALGEDPGAWGIPDTVVPKGFDVERLRAVLPRLDSNQQPSDYPSPLAAVLPFPQPAPIDEAGAA